MATLSNAKSGTITAANTSQLISAANPGRTYWEFQNTSPGVCMWLGIGAPATIGGGSLEVLPGDGFDSSANPELTQAAIYVACATSLTGFTFMEDAP